MGRGVQSRVSHDTAIHPRSTAVADIPCASPVSVTLTSELASLLSLHWTSTTPSSGRWKVGGFFPGAGVAEMGGDPILQVEAKFLPNHMTREFGQEHQPLGWEQLNSGKGSYLVCS